MQGRKPLDHLFPQHSHLFIEERVGQHIHELERFDHEALPPHVAAHHRQDGSTWVVVVCTATKQGRQLAREPSKYECCERKLVLAPRKSALAHLQRS